MSTHLMSTHIMSTRDGVHYAREPTDELVAAAKDAAGLFTRPTVV